MYIYILLKKISKLNRGICPQINAHSSVLDPNHHSNSQQPQSRTHATLTFDTSSAGQIRHSSTKGQDGDFNMPLGPIIRVRAKILKESFGNLAKSFVKRCIKNRLRNRRQI